MDAHLGGVIFFSDAYIDTSLKIQNGLSPLSLNASSTWIQVIGVSGSTGNIATNGTITAVGVYPNAVRGFSVGLGF